MGDDDDDIELATDVVDSITKMTETLQDAGVDPESLSPEELTKLTEGLTDSGRSSDDGGDDDVADATADADESSTRDDGGALGGSSITPLADAGPQGVGPADVSKLASLSFGTVQELTQRSVETSTRTSSRVLQAAVNANSPVELLDDSQEIILDEAQRFGINGQPVEQITSVGEDSNDVDGRREMDESTLLERGRQLLEDSADVTNEERTHPAYTRILDDLALDEARILRTLAEKGAQPAVNVYDKGWLPWDRKRVASRLSMLGSESGCQHQDRVSAYLNNLERLGLLEVSDEPVGDLTRYQILEAQPVVEEATEQAGRPGVERQKIQLTPFGTDFCRTCLPVEVADDEGQTGSQSESESDE